MNEQYKNFRISLRPPRVACLINTADANWQSTLLITIQSFSRTWGGAGFIIIPTDGISISKIFWEILLSYDPDYFWVAYPTADRYEVPLKISDDLVNKLKLRLAPFHTDDRPLINQSSEGRLQNLLIKRSTRPDFSATYPFTDTTTILPNYIHPNEIVEIVNLEGIRKIWAASVTGLMFPQYIEDLKNLGIERKTIDYSDKQSEFFNLIVKGVQRNLVVDNSAFPFTFSKANLAFYRSIEFADWIEATIVVVGETLEDFCLYFCLSRMRAKIVWLPSSWLVENAENSLANFHRALRELASENQAAGDTFFITTSITDVRLEAVRNLFRDARMINVGNGLPFEESEQNVEDSTNLPKSLRFLLRYPSRVFETDNFEKMIHKHVLGSEMAGVLEPPRPKNFSKIDKDHHWVTDLSIDKEHYPRHPMLGTEIVNDVFLKHNQARVGKDSIAIVDAKTIFSPGESMDSWLRKPKIYLPKAKDIFEILFRSQGYKSFISDKGQYEQNTISKFENLPTLANFLTTTKGRIFDRYILNRNLKPNDGGIFLKSDGRWYLNFSTFETILRDKISAASAIYYLLSISVLHRGLILKCELCRNTDWYSIAEISHEFQCKRCSLKQVYLITHVLSQLEPSWAYKLDEVVYQAIINNSKVPVLAKNYLLKNARTFDYCPELELRDIRNNAAVMEIDICCIQNGKIIIGEAKTSDCLANSKREENRIITKYFELSEKIGASQVVFATTSENWKEPTRQKVLSRFSNSLAEVLFLSGEDLLS